MQTESGQTDDSHTDVDYEKYSFGKLSALRETCLVMEMGYDYYYMGFYIHSCKKMRYKNDYKPLYILDPDTYQWNVLDHAMAERLDRKGFISLSRDKLAEAETGEAAGSTTIEAAASTLASPKAAEQSDQSLNEFGMPGILTQHELDSKVDLGKTLIQLGSASKPQFAPAEVRH